MPEGDTITKISAYLRERLVGEVLEGGHLQGHPGLDFEGRRVLSVEPHGKHLLVELDAFSLRSHLGMHGSWHRYRRDERWKKPRHAASFWLETGTDVYICFDAREVELGREARFRSLDHLGVDLLKEGCPPAKELQDM